jgi:hypothetical protein
MTHSHRVRDDWFGECQLGAHDECPNIEEGIVTHVCPCPCHDRRKPDDPTVPVDSPD